jgi:hypothetical protein
VETAMSKTFASMFPDRQLAAGVSQDALIWQGEWQKHLMERLQRQ